MQPALDRNTLDRLISLGREQGHLTTEDLRAGLPIESMTAEEIALIVAHLEEGGIPVELEDSLLSPDPKPRPPQTRSAEIIPFPDRAAIQRKARAATPLRGMAPLPPINADTRPQGSRRAHWAVAVAGLLVLMALGFLIHVLGI